MELLVQPKHSPSPSANEARTIAAAFARVAAIVALNFLLKLPTFRLKCSDLLAQKTTVRTTQSLTCAASSRAKFAPQPLAALSVICASMLGTTPSVFEVSAGFLATLRRIKPNQVFDCPVAMAECLDYVVVFGERHLRCVLFAYAAYYNQTRTHRSLRKDAPFGRAILGGLHHQYARI